jgi:hypothetical protein
MKTFYLGTHIPAWLGKVEFPLFLSRRRLNKQSTWRESSGKWALDSGAFTELNQYGKWTVPARKYADEAITFQAVIGKMDFASIQDWMCEPFVLKKTGLSVEEHQTRTVENYLELTSIAPEIPWMPVLQGFHRWEYVWHVEMYAREGVDLTKQKIVGVGSVCRRQGMVEVQGILSKLHGMGLKLHAFGVKKTGLILSHKYIKSADSMAWSTAGRREGPLSGCDHDNCANCLRFATLWRQKLLDVVGC